MDRLTLRRPDDWHLHLRDGPAMTSVLADAARQFARAIVMPNLKPPVRTTYEALDYRERILAALPEGAAFEPLMTLYLTDDTPPEEIARAKLSGRVHAVKLYPAGATTHSDAGVTRLSRCFRTLEKMEELGLPLLIHGESTDPAIDVFDREKTFIEEVLGPTVDRFSSLKVVLEHITTREAVQYVEVTGPSVAATITAHHLLMMVFCQSHASSADGNSSTSSTRSPRASTSSPNASLVSASVRSQCGVLMNARTGGIGGSSAARFRKGTSARGRVSGSFSSQPASCSARRAMSSIVRAKRPT